jgi:hypothetical protein
MQDIQTSANKYTAAQTYLREQPTYSPSQDKKTRNYVLLGFLVSITLIGFIAFIASFVFNGATVTITPTKKDQQVNESFVVEAESREGLLLVRDMSLSETVTLPKNSLKKASARAEGDIIIYNNFNESSQKLIKGTRFATNDGKIYRVQDSVTVPGKSGGNPGSVKAHVVADSEGDTYNIGPSRFSVPGFKGSSKYTAFYAESSKAMAGGSSGKTADVSDLDMEQGKTTIREKLQNAISAKLSQATPDGFAYSKDASLSIFGAMNLIDSDNTTATYEMAATGTAVYIKRDELVRRIVERTQNVDVSSASVEIKDSSNFVVSLVDPTDLTDPQKPVRLLVTGTAPVVFKPNKEKVIDFVVGKSRSEFPDITKKVQFVEGAKSVLRPFWSSTFPSDRDKIDVVIEE